MKMVRRLPTSPRIPTPFKKTEGTMNSKMKSTSFGGIGKEMLSNNVVLLKCSMMSDLIAQNKLQNQTCSSKLASRNPSEVFIII